MFNRTIIGSYTSIYDRDSRLLTGFEKIICSLLVEFQSFLLDLLIFNQLWLTYGMVSFA